MKTSKWSDGKQRNQVLTVVNGEFSAGTASTVGKLIENLQQLPSDSQLKFHGSASDGDFSDVSIIYIENSDSA